MKRIFVFIIVITFHTSLKAQLDAPKLILPAPEAFSFTKYGDIPVGLFTGTMTYSIPIMQIKSGKITVPVSLNYSSNGIKVDEVSGRTGMGWTLSAAGVITRNIIGKADDQVVIRPTNLYSDTSMAYYQFIKSVADQGSNVQPDEFSYSFAGYSGKFYFGFDSSIRKMTADGVKIVSTGYMDKFKIIAPDGFEYYFGDNGAKDYSDSYSFLGENDPLYSYGQGGCTAWHLTKIKSPSGDSVVYSYSVLSNMSAPIEYFSGISQSLPVSKGGGDGANMFYLAAGNCTSPGTLIDGNLTSSACIDGANIMKTDFNVSQIGVVRLDQIQFKQGLLRFTYSSRDDLPGENKLDSILMYSTAGKRVSAAKLDYEYSQSSDFNTPVIFTPYYGVQLQNNTTTAYLKKRLFLKTVDYLASDATQPQTYRLEYDDYNALPPRLSFAQDKFGYFNGKNNGSLLPNKTTIHRFLGNIEAGANRDVDSAFSKKGVLTKIVYPTGGYTGVKYESNDLYVGWKEVYDTVSAVLNGVSGTPVYSASFNSHFAYALKVNVSWITPPTLPGPNEPPVDIDSSVVVRIEPAGGGDCLVCNVPVYPGVGYMNSYLMFMDNSGPYRIKLTANDPNLYAEAKFIHIEEVAGPYNKITGGVRVGSITNFSGNDVKAFEKKFLYHNVDSFLVAARKLSSGALINDFSDKRDFFFVNRRVCSEPSGYIGFTYVLNSSAGLGGFSNDYVTVNYGNVTEQFDSAATTGMTTTTFKLSPNTLPFTLGCVVPVDMDQHTPFLIPGVPYSNTGTLNGKELEKTMYQKINGVFKKQRSTKSYYSVDSRLYRVDTFFAIRKIITRPSYYTAIKYFSDYDINGYKRISSWTHLDSTITKEFDNADRELKTKTVYSYENSDHLQATRVKTINSKGDSVVVKTKYPGDLSISTLVARNFISAPVLTESYTNTSLTSSVKVNYGFTHSTNIVPLSLQKSKANFALETELEFTKYNSQGSPTEFTAKGQYSAIIYDTAQGLMIAGVANADSGSVAYTSFESVGSGNWSVSSSSRESSFGLTGTRSYNLGAGSISKGGLTSGGKYVVTYWSKAGMQSVSGGTSVTRSGKTVSGWTLQEHVLTMSGTTVTVSGNGLIDELRLYPVGAQMATYTYEPLIGVTSQSDANNVVTYYEYDGFNRLKNIKDFDGNIVKNYQYNYRSSCGTNCYVLPLKTFTDYNTPGYPVGVFNINKQYLGIANNKTEYVTLWNANSANQAVGTLSADSDSLRFSLSLVTNAALPSAVFGLRYYQWDVFSPTTVVAGTDSLSFVDWGDGNRALVTGTRQAMNENQPFGYSSTWLRNRVMFYHKDVAHTYSNNNPRTITVFHNETTEYVDVQYYGINDSTQDAHIRGHYPERLKGLWYWGIGNSSDTAVKNFNKLTELVYAHYIFSGVTTKHNNWQSLQKSHKLEWLKLNFKNGNEIVPDMRTNFPQLAYIELHDFTPAWNTLWAVGGFPNLYHSVIGREDGATITAAEVDTIIINQAAASNLSTGRLGFGTNPSRTSASTAAKNILTGRSWSVEVNNP